MKAHNRIAQLRQAQAQADSIRRELGINAPRAVLYLAPLYATDDDVLLVEADGFGEATTSVIEGNYPIDYVTKREKRFLTEEEAVAAAADIIEHPLAARTLLAEPI